MHLTQLIKYISKTKTVVTDCIGLYSDSIIS